MNKDKIIHQLREELRARYQRAQDALNAATEAATGDDSKAEGKYDTRGLEASYLAAGQAEQADELARHLARFESLGLPSFEPDDAVSPGALVEVEIDDELAYYLLAPCAGGLSCDIEATDGSPATVTILAPDSPLRDKLIGHHSGKLLRDPELIISELW